MKPTDDPSHHPIHPPIVAPIHAIRLAQKTFIRPIVGWKS